MKIVFLDTETTSLRHDRRAWEIGLIVRWGNGDVDEEHSWLVSAADLDLGNADPTSLKIGRFYQRHPDKSDASGRTFGEMRALLDVEELTHDATIVGAVVNFDTEVLTTRMRANGMCPSWDHHIVDVETLAAGALHKPPPWKLDELLELYGITYDEADRHTALGDARLVRDLYDKVMADG
jgi:DNA polymerase III epsilon subunit-like protein